MPSGGISLYFTMRDGASQVLSAIGDKTKALDKETRNRIKDAERALEKVTRHKKADKITPADVTAINAAREALFAVATPLVNQWESEQTRQTQ